MIQERFENITLAYQRSIGPYGQHNRHFVENFKQTLDREQLLDAQSVIFGIALDDPARVTAEKLRYDLGLVLRRGQSTSLETRTLEDGLYVVFEVPHTEADILSFWKDLPVLTQGLPADWRRPIIERYAAPMIARHLCEMCVPLIRPL